MGILGKIFGTRQPAPPFEIHPDDQDLVTPEDIIWWNTLTVNDVVQLVETDNVFRYAAWKKFMARDGLSNLDAGKKVRLHWPTYYTLLVYRADEKF